MPEAARDGAAASRSRMREASSRLARLDGLAGVALYTGHSTQYLWTPSVDSLWTPSLDALHLSTPSLDAIARRVLPCPESAVLCTLRNGGAARSQAQAAGPASSSLEHRGPLSPLCRLIGMRVRVRAWAGRWLTIAATANVKERPRACRTLLQASSLNCQPRPELARASQASGAAEPLPLSRLAFRRAAARKPCGTPTRSTAGGYTLAATSWIWGKLVLSSVHAGQW